MSDRQTILVRSTAAFIALYPLDVVLLRAETVSDGAGGSRTLPAAPLAPQRVTIVETSGPSARQYIDTGTLLRTTHMVVGMPDLDIKADDTFTADGRDWKVDSVYFDNGYERRAAVIENG